MKRVFLIYLLMAGFCLAGPNKVLDLVLSGDFSSSDPWTEGAEFTIAAGVVNWLGAGTDTTLAQSTILLVDGNTYEVYVTVTNTDFAASDTYMGIQLGGGTAFQLMENQTFDVTTPLYLVCGSSPSSGLEFTAVNGTAGDDMTLDDIAVIVEQFKPSSNVDSVYVSGNIRVPAGTDVAVNGTFDADTDWTKTNGTPSGWSIGSGVATCDGNQSVDSDIVATAAPLTDKKTYLLTYTITRSAGTLTPVVGTALGTARSTSDTFSEILTTNGTALTFRADSAFVGTLDDVMAFELTTGPIDEYLHDIGTDFSGAPGAIAGDGFGIYNGERVYISVGTHADGIGGVDVNYYVRQRVGNNSWYVTATNPLTQDIPLNARWLSQGGSTLVDDYPVAGVISTGIATVTNGPTDHTIASSSPALETDGTAGRVFLNGAFDTANDIRETQWALVSIFKPLPDNDNTDRLISFETSDGVGYYWSQTATNTFNATWTGTTAVDLDFTASENNVHSLMNVSDIAANDSWFTVDGQLADSQTDAATLDAVDTVKFVLGSRADTGADFYNGVYAGQYQLDLTSVVTVDTAWITGLAQAINSAGTEATAIANAIFNYDNNIAGFYWPLNELDFGDASDYYLLARDITDNTEQTSSFYGLVSPAGVTGTSIGGGGYRGRINDGGRYQGTYRPRYN